MNILFSEHHLLILLSLGSLLSFGWLFVNRKKLSMKIWEAALLSVLHTIYGVLSVKVFAVIEGFGDPSVIGNMSLFGGVFFMPIAYWLIAKIKKLRNGIVFDVFTPCLVVTLLCARINCIIGNCCQGRYITGTSGMRWPTRELEICFYIVLLAVICRKILTGKSNGNIYLIYMMSYGIFRFLEEGLRESDRYLGYLHLGHIWAMITLTVGFSIYTEIQRRNMKKDSLKVRR